MSIRLKDQIAEQVDRLAEPQQRLVLSYSRVLTPHAGRTGANLLRFAGTITAGDLDAMSRAIESGCETVDADAW